MGDRRPQARILQKSAILQYGIDYFVMLSGRRRCRPGVGGLTGPRGVAPSPSKFASICDPYADRGPQFARDRAEVVTPDLLFTVLLRGGSPSLRETVPEARQPVPWGSAGIRGDNRGLALIPTAPWSFVLFHSSAAGWLFLALSAETLVFGAQPRFHRGENYPGRSK